MEIIFFEKHLAILRRFFVSVLFFSFFLSFFFLFFFFLWDVLAKPGSTKQSAKHSTGPMRIRPVQKKKKKYTNKQTKRKKGKGKGKTKQSKKQQTKIEKFAQS